MMRKSISTCSCGTWHLLASRSGLVVAAVVLAGVVLASGCSRRVDAGPAPNMKDALELREKLASASKSSDTSGSDSSGSDSSGSGDASAAVEASGWATLDGKFTYAGTPPVPAAIDANKDPEVCGKHKLVDEGIVVGPGGGLANVVIFVRTPKVPVNPAYEKSAGHEKVLDNKDCRFEPHVLSLRTSQKLAIRNSDPVGHNSKGDAQSNAPFNPIIPSGQSYVTQLAKEEALPIKVGCNIHPWMGAWVVVRNDPYVAVSSKDGAFAIKDLPAGVPLEFQLWQEKSVYLKNVEVAGVKVDGKGRFKLTLKPGEDKTLEFKVTGLK